MLRAAGALGAPFVPSRQPPATPARILVVRPDHLGDALFTTPALRALRQAFPGAEIVCLVGPWASAVYGRLPHVERLIECECPGFAPQPKPSPWQPYGLLLRTAAELRRQRFAVALNLRFDFWWGALLSFAAAVPTRVGYGVPECAPFLTVAAAYARGHHEVVQNLALVAHLVACAEGERERWLKAQLAAARLEFPLQPAERQAAADFLREVGSGATAPAVAIHPGTRGRAKLWTAEGWAAVADALAQRLGAVVLLTGTAAEEGLCLAVQQRMRRRAVVLAGRTTLGELVALFERCALVLGVDSGPLHLATAAGTPTVHLYGPSDHVAFGPFGDPARHAVVRAGVYCSPCHKFDWPLDAPHEHDCMRAISPAMVLEAAEGVLQSGAAERTCGCAPVERGGAVGTDPAVPSPAQEWLREEDGRER